MMQRANQKPTQPLMDAMFGLQPPIIVFNTAHSGSRLLTQLLRDAGVFMGAHLNSSLDSLDLAPVVQRLVGGAMPGGSRSTRQADGDDELAEFVARQVKKHLTGAPGGMPWGWKLCETLLVYPEIDRLFPGARFIHLIRDGRDVALSPFVAPKDPYWRRVYFGTDRVQSWHGFPMTQRAYQSFGHLFNAHRWRYHVDLGRTYGAAFGERYIEIRYEDLVLRHDETRAILLSTLGLDAGGVEKSQRMQPHAGSIGKWRRLPRGKLRDILALVETKLTNLGYNDCTEIPPVRSANLIEQLWTGIRWPNGLRG
jgi:Sulfotransferase family